MYTKRPQSDIQSFFRVGGIHGLPFIVWDGATGNKPFDPNSQWGGYCTHGSVLFPTWHRPYVMLYEVFPPSFFNHVLIIDETIILISKFCNSEPKKSLLHTRWTKRTGSKLPLIFASRSGIGLGIPPLLMRLSP